MPAGLAGLVHKYDFAPQIVVEPQYGGAKVTFPGSHNAALDVIQHGNVALAIAGDAEYLGQGLHEDDFQTLATVLGQPLPQLNRNIVLLSIDYEGHDHIKDVVTEFGFWSLDSHIGQISS